jgi:hypothetical protein
MKIRLYAYHKHADTAGNPMAVLIALVFFMLPLHSHAQQQSNPDDSSQTATADSSPLLNAAEVLRLEQTIRANKEQPQVLTIVPWQLPTHQRISENTAWQPVVEQLPIIERNQFLRDLAIADDILSESAKVSVKKEQP